jgi:cell division septum initiation protein DivIVA
MKELRILQRENNERRHEIETLQEQLFSGTSIQESRKSVELADVTMHQGYNIKVLTIVNLFFMVSQNAPDNVVLFREANCTTASYVRHVHLWHDKYARRTRAILAICHHTCRNLYTLFQYHWISIHKVWLSRLGNEDSTAVAMATPKARSRRRDRNGIRQYNKKKS